MPNSHSSAPTHCVHAGLAWPGLAPHLHLGRAVPVVEVLGADGPVQAAHVAQVHDHRHTGRGVVCQAAGTHRHVMSMFSDLTASCLHWLPLPPTWRGQGSGSCH